MKKLSITLPTLLLSLLASSFCVAEEAQSNTQDNTQANSLEELLNLVEQARVAESAQQRKRQQQFLQDKSNQKKVLDNTHQEKLRQEKRSVRLETTFERNEELIAVKEEQLQKRLGSLTELFGHLTATAGDLRSEMDSSVISAQYPDRDEHLTSFIDKMSGSTQLPSVEEIEMLWFEAQREMTESGKVVSFEKVITDVDGSRSTKQVIRVGAFNLLNEGNYLRYDSDTETVSVLPRQPDSGWLGNAFTSNAKTLQNADSAYHPIAIDPTGPSGGSYLAALINSPSLLERWKQGGLVGLVITVLGVFAFALAAYRLFALNRITVSVNKQLNIQQADTNNPLGRVLQAYEENKNMEVESLEYKLAEAITRERPAIEKGTSSLKIIAMVAPLLGLLGTVTGMIMTFQAITVYGAGDPQAMAGGISSALVTTVLGLCVAVPTVMLHAFVNSRCKGLLSILEQQSLGLIAERDEQTRAG